MSRSKLDKLGERLAAAGIPTDEDLALLLEVLSAYQAALAEVQQRLRELGYRPTTRTKTTGVLIEKLRRERSSLKSVQDIAGARIVSDCDRSEQDDIVSAVVETFSDGTRAPKVKDRRALPSSGYRAVHVIVTVGDLPVEIQIRTQRQDQWAQIVEALGDKWGRGIRYGEGPPEPERPLGPHFEMTRARLWTLVVDLSARLDAVEQFQHAVNELTRIHDEWDEPGVLTEEADAVREASRQDVDDLKESLHEAETKLSRDLALFASVAETLE